MTDWDLLTPGIGLTSIGIVGVVVSLSGIAKTFIDGMHAVSLLTFLLGMIFLVSGLFKDGFPSSRKAKSASFITLAILVAIGLLSAYLSTVRTPSILIYIGIIALISIPGVASIIGIYRNSSKVKLYVACFVATVILGIASLSFLGIQNPAALSEDSNKTTKETAESSSLAKDIDTSKFVKVNILAGSSAQGNPDYDPDELIVGGAPGIVWFNLDNVPHTVTSLKDDGKSFDSSIINLNGNYTLLVSDLTEKNYEYFCTIHPYMKATLKIG